VAKIAKTSPQLEIKNVDRVVWKEIQERSGAMKKDVSQLRQYYMARKGVSG